MNQRQRLLQFTNWKFGLFYLLKSLKNKRNAWLLEFEPCPLVWKIRHLLSDLGKSLQYFIILILNLSDVN